MTRQTPIHPPSPRFAQQTSEPDMSSMATPELKAYEDAIKESERALDAMVSGQIPDDMKFDPKSNFEPEPLAPVGSFEPAETIPDEQFPVQEETESSYQPTDDNEQVVDESDLPNLEDVQNETISRAHQYESSLYDQTLQQARYLEQQNQQLQSQLNKATDMLQDYNHKQRNEYIKKLEEGQKLAVQNQNETEYYRITRALMKEYAKDAQQVNPHVNPSGTMSPYIQEYPQPVYQNPSLPPYQQWQQQNQWQGQQFGYVPGQPMHNAISQPMMSPVYQNQPLPQQYQQLYPHLYGQPQQPAQHPLAQQEQQRAQQVTQGLPGRKTNASGGAATVSRPAVVKKSGEATPQMHQMEYDLVVKTPMYDDKGSEIRDIDEKIRRHLKINANV